MKDLFKGITSIPVAKARDKNTEITVRLTGDYAAMMDHIDIIYRAYMKESNVTAESVKKVRQIIFDQAMSQFSSHNPVITLPGCEFDMSVWTLDKLSEVADKLQGESEAPVEAGKTEESKEAKGNQNVPAEKKNPFGN